jgi:hypothetical protein
MVEKMETLLEYLRNAQGQTVDVDDAFVRLTFDTLGVLVYGKDFSGLGFDDMPIKEVGGCLTKCQVGGTTLLDSQGSRPATDAQVGDPGGGQASPQQVPQVLERLGALVGGR